MCYLTANLLQHQHPIPVLLHHPPLLTTQTLTNRLHFHGIPPTFTMTIPYLPPQPDVAPLSSTPLLFPNVTPFRVTFPDRIDKPQPPQAVLPQGDLFF